MKERRASKSDFLKSYAGTIGKFCEESYTCGCPDNCCRLFQYSSYMNNIKHRELLSQKDFKALMMTTFNAAVVREGATGTRVIPDNVPFKYNEKPVCQTTFQNLWGLSPASFFRYKKECLEASGVLPPTTVFRTPEKQAPVKKVTSCYEAFVDWAMLHFLKGLPQDMPASGTKQISAPDYNVLFKSYRENCPEATQVVQGVFRGYCTSLLREENVIVRQKIEVTGMCTTCDDLQAEKHRLQYNDPDPAATQVYYHRKQLHEDTHKHQRQEYDRRRRDGSDPRGSCDSIALDGAANHNTVVPHAPHKVKSLNEKKQHFFNLHLQLTILHGTRLVFHVAYPWSAPKGANMMLTTLCGLLQLQCQPETNGRYLRRTLCLQVDGGSENWNRYVFGFMALLVHYDIYEKIELHRLQVGHTHNDVDGWFGLMKMQVFGKDATKAGKWLITLEEYIDWIKGWTIKRFDKDVYVQGSQLDFKEWLHPHVNHDFTGHCGIERVVHFLHFEKDINQCVRMKYKNGVQLKRFLPVGVENDSTKGLIVMKSYPDLTTSPPLAKVTPLDDEKDTKQAFLRIRDNLDNRITEEQHNTIMNYFPLPKSLEDYDTWSGPPPDVQPPLDLRLLQSRAWHNAPAEPALVLPVEEAQVETLADGIGVRVKDLPVQVDVILAKVITKAKFVEDINYW